MSKTGRQFALLAVVSALLGFVGYGPVANRQGPATTIQVEGGDVAKGRGPGKAGPSADGPTVVATEGVAPSRPGLECAAGRNGGPTGDPGVSATEIKLAATVVTDGPAKSLLEPSTAGMKAVIDRVNAKGGICGRRLSLTVANDSFDAAKGQQYIRNFIAEDYFALAVVPSSEGLSAAISSGDIDRAGIPVVGTNGMRIEQYQSPWVWPVATATVSTMRVMATSGARERNAKTFAIVWDGKYKFGVEGATAFKKQVEAFGGRIVADVRLDPEQPSYSTEVAAFNEKCGGGKCDMVALLLLPDTATKWMEKKPAMGKRYTAGAQTLFTDEFANSCVRSALERCHGMAVWTGYLPPIGRYAGLPDIERYVDDVSTVRPGIDVRNQFLEGAYLGMELLMDALRRVGPDLTRARLKQVLDSATFRYDLTSPLSWTPARRSANIRARSFAMVVSNGGFRGWGDENSGWVADPAGGA